jgi:hypothetical protein
VAEEEADAAWLLDAVPAVTVAQPPTAMPTASTKAKAGRARCHTTTDVKPGPKAMPRLTAVRAAFSSAFGAAHMKLPRE